MNYLLLTGAGFTRNWGGWLAREIEGDILGRVQDMPRVRCLVQSSNGFESALESLERDMERGIVEARADHESLQRAVSESFRAMNLALAERPGLEFSNDRAFSVTAFLARFDIIFTLNQDLLLELHYDPSLEAPSKWIGCEFPGVGGASSSVSNKEIVDQRKKILDSVPQVSHGFQPIYKLHGSADWFDGSGELLVMGGGKERRIASKAILSTYFDRFRICLNRPGTRLMIVGYGFGDEHINALLSEAAQTNSDLRVFFVGPDGRDPILPAKSLPQWVPPLGYLSCNGESRRPIWSTFSGDRLEFQKLIRFFG